MAWVGTAEKRRTSRHLALPADFRLIDPDLFLTFEALISEAPEMARRQVLDPLKSEIAERVRGRLAGSSTGQFQATDILDDIKRSALLDHKEIREHLLDNALNGLIAAVCRRVRPADTRFDGVDLFGVPWTISSSGGIKKDTMSHTFAEARLKQEKYERRAEHTNAVKLGKLIDELMPYRSSDNQTLAEAAASRARSG